MELIKDVPENERSAFILHWIKESAPGFREEYDQQCEELQDFPEQT